MDMQKKNILENNYFMILESYNSSKIRTQSLGEGTPLESGTCSANPKQGFEIVKNEKRIFLEISCYKNIVFGSTHSSIHTNNGNHGTHSTCLKSFNKLGF